MITLTAYNKEGLRIYLSSERYAKSSVIPISVHRAISHLHNPSVREEDILLILAEANDELAGYLGIVPDDLYVGNHVHHVGWMSCLWVDERFRGQKIGQNLVRECMERWQGNILLTEFTKEAEALYQKTQYFEPFRILEGIRYYVKSDLQTILPPKFPRLTPYRFLLSLVDKSINALSGIRKVFSTNKKLHYNVVNLSFLDEEMASFITAQRGNTLCNRGAKELQWILDYPWILPGDKTSTEARRYHFSSFEQNFTCEAIKVTDQRGTIYAVAIITNRNGHLRIPYFYSSLQNDVVAEIIAYLIRNRGIKTVTIFQKELTEACQQTPVLSLYSKAQKRKYLMAKPLFSVLGPVSQQAMIYDGDGDCAFT